MKARAARAAAAAIALGLAVPATGAVSCSAEPEVTSPPGADAAAPVDGARAVRDARSPAPDVAPPPPADARRPDAGEPLLTLPGEWLKIPGLPDECAARVAKDPSVALPPFPWRACTSGRTGCEVFLADWGVRGGDNFVLSHFTTPYEDARGVHISHYRTSRYTDLSAIVSAVHTMHGDAELVIAGTVGGAVHESCGAMKVHASTYGYGMTINWYAPGDLVRRWAGWSPPDAPNLLSVAELTGSLGALNSVPGMTHGDGFLALEQTSSGGPTYASAFRFADRALVTSTPTNSLRSSSPVPVSGGYFALVTGTNPYTLGFMPLDGGYRTVVQPLAGSDVQVIWVDRARANALVWTEQARATGEVTLYTSPFATDAAGVVRRAVARFPYNVFGAVNAGLFAYHRSSQAVRILRLSDGMGWELAGETDAPMMYPTWINESFVWSVVSALLEREPGFPISAGVLRVALPAGPPTIPNGL